MKYSELRLFILHSIFCLLLIIAGAYFYLIADKIRLLIILFMIVNLLFILFVRNKLKIFDDSFVAYSYRGIGILPYIIEFSDLDCFELLSKHRIRITTKQKKVTLYIMNASLFCDELTEKYDSYQQTVTS
ncbi:hypothetical protein [Tannockella kyphosi]|uniref:hypothetical protein n=1 Tax=Tannockella kyphosi TaxID=2899121 RepID=UPI0020122C82|nr:hypothetical protein [Tannockella kyphosi]